MKAADRGIRNLWLMLGKMRWTLWQNKQPPGFQPLEIGAKLKSADSPPVCSEDRCRLHPEPGAEIQIQTKSGTSDSVIMETTKRFGLGGIFVALQRCVKMLFPP